MVRLKIFIAVLFLQALVFVSADNIENTESLRVALWGYQFYSDEPDQKQQEVTKTIASINSHSVDFTIYVGDTKNGHTFCTDNVISKTIKKVFDALNAPTIYTLGNNEWTDCHRLNNGSYDPLERLAFLRKYFFQQTLSQGLEPIHLKRQGYLGEAFSENSHFEKNNVMFATVHVVGSNNNLIVTDNRCFKDSNRTVKDCADATSEFKLRTERNVEWLRSSFAQAKSHKNKGIVIAIHGNPYYPIELSGDGYQNNFLPSLDEYNGYTDFFKTLIVETQNFEGDVVLIHGESDYFRIDKAMFNDDGSITQNFTRVEVFGEKENDWVEMTVDPNSDTIFSFKPVIVK